MNYEKLTVDSFIANAQAGKYAGLTGARRAIGKANWSPKDKKRAAEFADKHFADGKHAVKKEAAVRPPAKKAKRSAAASSVKKPAKRAAKKAPAVAAAAAVRRSPVTRTPSTQKELFPTPLPRLMNGDDPTTVRQHAASAVIAAYRNTGSLNPLEQRAYDIATAEYSENARDSARRLVAAASDGLTLPELAVPASDDNASTAVGSDEFVGQPGGPARIVVPPTPATQEPSAQEDQAAGLDPAARAQHERLKRAAAAANFPVPPTAAALDHSA
jgi:hypothetical protein